MQNLTQLQHWLYEHIPACQALGLVLQQAEAGKVTLSADFAINRNHHGTVFGGSQSLMATACAWLAVHTQFTQAQGNIVIRQSHIRYLAPASDKIVASCQILPEQKHACQTMLDKKDKGKITVLCQLSCHKQTVAVFEGEFVINTARSSVISSNHDSK